jgi:hypothetical protein
MWYPGAEGNPIGDPAYELPIRVVDQIGPTLRFLVKRRWYTARAAAFEEWGQSGVPFVIQEGMPGTWPPTNLATEAINIIPGPNSSGGYIQANPLFPGSPCGYAQCLIVKGLTLRRIRYILAHEAGHALGFAHGGTGVMAGAWRPNDEEIAALEAYYGG